MSDKRKRTEFDAPGGLHVHMAQMRPKKALRVSAQLARFLLPVFAGMDPNAEVTPEVTTQALMNIGAGGMDGDAVERLCDELLTNAIVIEPDGNGGARKRDLCVPGAIDDVFDGNLAALFKCLKESIALNFADFFGARGPNAKPVPTTAA
jgi:hypothetical protein